MELKRTIKCSNCGVESNVQLSSDLNLKELLIAGKCNQCGSAMHISYALVDSSSISSSSSVFSSSSTSSSSDSSSALPNLDESIFGGGTSQVESDTLKDLMED